MRGVGVLGFVLMLSACTRGATAVPEERASVVQDSTGYRVVVPRPDGSRVVGPVVWEPGDEAQCERRESPEIRETEGELVLSIRWEASDLVEVCEPDGCTSGHMDCECSFRCLPERQGVCELVLDPETLGVVERRGDCLDKNVD